MRFSSTMSAMSRNKNHVSQFAEKMGWTPERAEATLAAYGTGQYFPTKAELNNMDVSESLHWAYLVALNAYHLDSLIKAGHSHRLFKVLQKSTIDKWRNGNAMPSQRSKIKIEKEFTIDLQAVPSECEFVYDANDKAKIQLDLRRSCIMLNGTTWFFIKFAPGCYIINLCDIVAPEMFYAAVTASGLEVEECGDMMKAVRPSSKVTIYYMKP